MSVIYFMKIRVNDIDVNYELLGRVGNPVVLFSHSLAANFNMWDSQIDSLIKDFQILRYDIRGHGKTDSSEGSYTLKQLANDLFGLLDKLKINSCHFVGLSLGGMIGQTAALMNPNRFNSLSLCDTSSKTPTSALEMWEKRITKVKTKGMKAIANDTLDRWFSAEFQNSHISTVADIRDMIESTSIDGYSGCSAAIMELNLLDQISEIQLPTLLIVGEHDPGTPVAGHKLIKNKIANARLFIVKDALHLSNIEGAQAFNDQLVQFLSEIGE